MFRIYFLLLILLCAPASVVGQELSLDKQEVYLAKVLSVESEKDIVVPGTDIESSVQSIQAEILEGEYRGSVVNIQNDYLQLSVGQKFYLLHTVSEIDSAEYYSVLEPYRLPAIYFFIGLFICCVLIFGGVQGFRGLVSLVLSSLCIVYVLLPGIIQGYSPVWLSIGVSSLIIVLGSYITHGFNKTTTSAVLGMVCSIFITGILAHFAVDLTQLTGFESEEALYLHFSTGGGIDFVGLLLGGIMIGLLGVLYDAGISQAISVEELHNIAPHLPRNTIYKRALRMGREHIGALVDTLAIAYVGAALPLLLLFYSSSTDILQTINREIFAAEIIRTMVGSIGLIIAVPITTFIASLVLIRNNKTSRDPSIIKAEEDSLEHFNHKH